MGLSSNFVITIVKASVILLFFVCLRNKSSNQSIKGVVSFFILYILLSGWKYIDGSRPFYCYYDAFNNFILPMLLFYVGYNYDTKDKMYMSFGIAFSIPLVLTLVDYILLSPWYLNYLVEFRHDDGVSADYVLNFLHFSGPFVEPYYVMYLGFPVLAYILERIMIKKERSIILYVLLSVFFVSLILCQQRTAMLSAVFALLYFAYFSKNGKMLVSILAVFTIIVGLFLLRGDAERISIIQDLLADRAENMSFSSAFGQRQNAVFRVFPLWSDYIFGDGVGFYSHAAFYSGYISVNDCGWIKLLVENGVLGVLFFLIIIVKSLLRGLKLKFYSESLVILFYMLAMVGSDSLSMDISHSLFFWYSIGYIWNKNVLQNRRNLNPKNVVLHSNSCI